MFGTRIHFQNIVRAVREFFEDQWFDRTRNVRTSGNVSLHTAGIATDELRDSELYVPARPAHIRQALREMPAGDVSGYTYIDLGSGKGRTLFVAAEIPFGEILGVEFPTACTSGPARTSVASGSGDGAAPGSNRHT